MRLSVIKYMDNEKIFYNPGIFSKEEDMIIFPFKEFDKFYNETVSSLNVVKRIIEDSLNPESTTNPAEDLEHVEDWINLIKEDMDLLIKFDVQTTLNSFHEESTEKIETIENRSQQKSKVFVASKSGDFDRFSGRQKFIEFLSAPKKVSEVTSIHRGQIQCLMGL